MRWKEKKDKTRGIRRPHFTGSELSLHVGELPSTPFLTDFSRFLHQFYSHFAADPESCTGHSCGSEAHPYLCHPSDALTHPHRHTRGPRRCFSTNYSMVEVLLCSQPSGTSLLPTLEAAQDLWRHQELLVVGWHHMGSRKVPPVHKTHQDNSVLVTSTIPMGCPAPLCPICKVH